MMQVRLINHPLTETLDMLENRVNNVLKEIHRVSGKVLNIKYITDNELGTITSVVIEYERKYFL